MDGLTDIHGAIYIPARSYNAYQCWRNYDPDAVERDLSYAARLGLNAIRVFCSFERWVEDEAGFGGSVDHLLDVAASRGIRVLPILFESAGEEPTRSNLTDRDPTTACAVRSPSNAVIRAGDGGGGGTGLLGRVRGGSDGWAEPRAFVAWFVDRYGDDDRLLAIELVNEPGGWAPRERFAAAMLRTAVDHDPTRPLTMGCKSIENNGSYTDPPLDVFQFHHNIPATAEEMRTTIGAAVALADESGKPVWLTEWQRTREEPPDRMEPNYASIASVIRGSDLDGEFFWSLMLKPAWLPKMRRKGRLNGLFHEDGSVWSADDFAALAVRAIDGPDRTTERREWPSWYDR